MPLLRIPVLLPSMGMDYSRPATLIDNANCFPQNMSFSRGDITKRAGRSLFGDTAISGAPVMGYGTFYMGSGARHILRVSTNNLEKYNELTNVWDDIAVTPFSGDADDYFAFATVAESDLIAISNGVDNIRKWTGSGNQQLLGGTPPICKTMCYLSPYLILGNLIESGTPNPWKVAWCDTANPEIWTGGNSGSELLSDESSEIVRLKKLNEYAAAYKKDSLWLGRLDVSDVISFDCVKTGIGIVSKNAVAEAEAVHYFMGYNDFYSWDSSGITPIGKGVRDEVFSTIDKTQLHKCFAVHAKDTTEIWFAVVTTGQTYPTQIWKYNYRYGIWYFDTIANITAGIEFEGNAFAERTILGDSSGYSYRVDPTAHNDNGVAISSYVITKDFVADKFEYEKRWLQIDLWAYGSATLYVDYSIDRGTTWTSLSSATLEASMPIFPITLWFDVVSSHIRFRFRNAGDGEYFYLRKFFPYYLGREEAFK